MSPWTDARVEKLKRGWSDGMSATLIAREINGEDGSLSRNAVVGKAHRLGLPSRKTVTFAARGGRIRRFNTPKSAASRRGGEAPAAPPAPIPAPVIDPLTLEHQLHFMSAENHHCHWPLWGDDTPFAEKFFCGTGGCDVNERRPYCGPHTRMSVNPLQPRKPQKYWTEKAA